MKTDTELCDYDIRQKKQKENLKIMGGVNMKKTATRLTDEEIWRKELDKIYSATTDKSPKELQMTVFIKSIMAQARAEGKKEGIADGQKKQKKDRFYFGYDKGFVEGKSDLKKRLESILLNPKMVDKIIKGNLMKYDRDIVMKIITLSWEKAIAEAEKGGKR